MMRKRTHTSAMIMALLAASGCGGANEQRNAVASARQPLGLPVPCEGHEWGGTNAELVFADAMAGCDVITNFQIGEENYNFVDSFNGYLAYTGSWYAQGVMEHMRNTLGDYTSASFFEDWVQLRTDNPEANCSAETGEPGQRASLPTPDYLRHVRLLNGWFQRTSDFFPSAQSVFPAYHLCVAQALRDVATGSVGTGSLGVSAVDQIELLEAARGEVQQTAIQLSSMAVIMTAQNVFGSEYDNAEDYYDAWYLTDPPEENTVALFQGASRFPNEFEQAALVSAGEDLAAAVQLHIAITRDLLSFYARNRSAGVPSQSESPKSRAEAMWGPGSWHARMLHLAYGGDPLYMPDGGPWVHPTRDWSELPAYYAASFQYPGRLGMQMYAPSGSDAPYVAQSVQDPGVDRLYGVLEEAGGVPFVVSDGSQAPQVEETGTLLFTRAEENLRELAGLPAGPIPSEEKETLLWKNQRVSHAHAETLAALLAESLGYGGHLGRVDKGPVPGTAHGGRERLTGGDVEVRCEV